MNYRPKGMTQERLCELTELSRDTICRYEKGKNVSIQAENKILAACGKKKVVTDINS